MTAATPAAAPQENSSRSVGQLITGESGKSPAVKAQPVVLPEEPTAGEVFAACLRSCFDQLEANQALFLSGRHPDNLHQLRVSWRRARAAFSLFGRLVRADEEGMELQVRMREIVLPLGPARDADVLLAQAIQDEWPARAQRALRGRRRRTYAVAAPLLRSPQWVEMKSDLQLWLANPDWLAGAEKRRDAPAREVTDRALAKRFDRIAEAGPDLLTMHAHDLHRIRIQGKKFRYGTEFFADLYADAPGDSPATYGKTMSTMQDAFGAANDLATAVHILRAHGLPTDVLDTEHSRFECVAAWEQVMALTPFWDTKV